MEINTGKIVQVLGPVVDVEFDEGKLPLIKDALTVEVDGKKVVMEVAQLMGNRIVRCITLAASEGLAKDMVVTATGDGIKVPVGEGVLGRMFNVLGEAIDGGEEVKCDDKWVIHRDPPSFEDQSPVVEILETGIKVIDLLALTQKVVKSVYSVILTVYRHHRTNRFYHPLRKGQEGQ